ncbi:MAG TPA: glycosyltransferase family 4 protein [Gaiellaceae bacterium]|nr:glycosyltransferase family 4 protein [Gaiellaceae bacterium]
MHDANGHGAAPPPRPILFVHHRSELGGAPTSLYYLIRDLDRTLYEPHVFCPAGPAAELFREAGATVHTGTLATFTHIWASTYHGRRWVLLLRELVNLPRHLRQFSRTLKSHPFALVHLNDSPLIAAAWLANRAGVPVVWHLRSALPGGGTDRRSRAIRSLVKRFADVAVAINEDVAASFDVDSVVVPNSVDLAFFRGGDQSLPPAQLGLSGDKPVVAYFGFLYPSKGFQEFIRAAALLRRQGVDAVYLIVGGAVRSETFFSTPLGLLLRVLGLARNYEEEAKELTAEFGLSEHVHFIPFTRTIENLYRASDVVVAPSQGPEVGRSVIEAAAAGVPVIASGTKTGAGIILPDETGVLVPDWTAPVLAAAIADLLGDPERRQGMGAAARAHAELTFDASLNARRIEAVYERLVRVAEPTPILFVHHRPQLGGAPSSLAHLIRHLDRRRYEPHVVVPDGPAAELLADAGAIVHTSSISIFAHPWDQPYAGLRWIVLGRELAALPRHVADLTRLIRRYRFPIVHLNDSPLLPAAFVARRLGSRVVWHLRSSLAGGGADRRSRAIRALMGRWGDAAIAIDRDVARNFDLSLPLTIVPNSALGDPNEIDHDEARRRLGLPPERVVVGYAGFVRRQKGWPELVRAARIMADDGVPAHFLVMGGGVRPPAYFRTTRGRLLQATGVLWDEESEIRQLVSELHLDDRFTFLPYTRDTAEVYAALDIVTFPNQGVGLGRPVLEAAVAGRPVVASGSPDGAEILLPGVTGILLEDPTPEAIAGALTALTNDPELRHRLGAAAAEYAHERFDPERNARLVEDVYDHLLGHSRASALPEAELAQVGRGVR